MTKILNDPRKYEYTDVAITRHGKDELDSLDLFNCTRGGKEAVTKYQKRQFPRIDIQTGVN